MRTDRSEPDLASATRTAARGERLRVWMAGLGVAGRRRIALAVIGIAIVAGFLLVTREPSPTTTWLDNGRVFSADEAQSVARALGVKGIVVVHGDRGQLGVPTEQQSVALKAIESLGLARRSLQEEFDRPAQVPPWADPAERRQLILRNRERKIEVLIGRYPGVAAVTVRLHEREGARFAAAPLSKATVFVAPIDPGAITPDLIDRIRLAVVANEPDLDRDRDVTILDQKDGQAYFVAGDPEVAHRSRADAQAHEWESALTKRLGALVPGARVSVRMEWSTVESTPTAAAPVVIPNAPATLSEPSDEPRQVGKAKVLVELPTRSLVDLYRSGDDSNHEPTPVELGVIEQLTRRQIEAEVRHVIPAESFGQFDQVRIPLPPSRAAAASAPRADLRERWAWAAAAALGTVVLLIVATAGTRRLGSSRRVATPRDGTAAQRIDLDDRAGPVDRVRELIRRDPDAAAGVLRRWIGQGGGVR